MEAAEGEPPGREGKAVEGAKGEVKGNERFMSVLYVEYAGRRRIDSMCGPPHAKVHRAVILMETSLTIIGVWGAVEQRTDLRIFG